MVTKSVDLAKIAYEAYCASTNGNSPVTGAELPDFKHVPAAVRNAWVAAAKAVEQHVEKHVAANKASDKSAKHA